MEDGDLRWCCGSSSSCNDWDLHAVVRSATSSCSGGSRVVVTSPRASEESLFSGSGVPLPQPQSELPIGGPDVDDLRANGRSGPQARNEEEPPPQRPPAPKPRSSYRNNNGAGGGGSTTRSQRRKKKSQVSKKEVTRVPVGASSPPDPWAWRKYGQKPIKGSPYPRGYYRCSTDKDCRARKQVERCRTDPSTLIVSYSGGEHSHPVPLHRNELAGTTRNKPRQRQPASSSSTSPADEQPPAAASSSSPIIDTSSASLLLLEADAEMEGDVLSFLAPSPPSPTKSADLRRP